MTQFDNEKHFFTIFPTILIKQGFFFRQPDRMESFLVTFQNVKNSPAAHHRYDPKNDL